MKKHLDEPTEIDGEWIYPDGTALPVLTGGEGDEPETPAASDTPPGEAVPDEGGAEGGDGDGEEPPVPEDRLDPIVQAAQAEMYEGEISALENDALGSVSAQIDEMVAQAQASPDTISMEDIARLKALRVVQGQSWVEAARRFDVEAERLRQLADVAAGLPEADPETPAAQEEPLARAASMSRPSQPPADLGQHRAAIAAMRDRRPAEQSAVEAEPSVSHVASPGVLAQRTRWVSTQGNGGEFSLASAINGTRPVKIRGQIQERDESILAAAVLDRDEATMLTDSRSNNERLMRSAMAAHREARAEVTPENQSHLAALCAPAQIIREAMQCGTDAVPLQGALVNMEAISGNENNLSFSYRRSTSLADADDGVGSFTSTQQAAVTTDPATWKPCQTIACPGYENEEATEFTACYETDAFTELSSPESVADFEQAMGRAYARFTEAWFLRKLDTFLYHTSHIAAMGAVPDIIEAVLTALANGHYAERMDLTDYVVFGSPGLLYAATIDENKRAYAQSPGRSMEDVLGIVRDATGTDYVQLYDLPLSAGGAVPASPFGSLGAVGAAGATALPTIGDGVIEYQLRVIDPSAFIGYNLGEATFGQQITHDQARQNKRGFFQRVFGGLMKPGCAPGYRIDIRVCTNGARGGFYTPTCGTGGGS